MVQHPIGVHHLAFMAADIKSHIAFFSEVLGCPLVGLFDMHGVPGGLHAFLKLNEASYLSVVQLPGVGDIPIEIGKTHAGRGEAACAAGALQHLALRVGSDDELIQMRNRIRSNGVNVLGPIDHGFCRSIYFAGPDHMTLEISVQIYPMAAERWVDPAVLERAGISEAEAQRYQSPAPYAGPPSVAQPPFDPSKPHMAYPEDVYLRMLAAPDEAITAAASFSEPPVAASA